MPLSKPRTLTAGRYTLRQDKRSFHPAPRAQGIFKVWGKEIKLIIKKALKEDIGERDVTTILTIPYHLKVEGIIIAKEEGVFCGLDIVREVFRGEDKKLVFKPFKKEGETFRKNQIIASIKGDARMILTRERVALNFLSLLSGIATYTKKFVQRVKGTKVKIMDTRKTTPNLRILEKYAVRVGGGYNHRRALEECILIKDNHLKAGKFIHNPQLDEVKIKQLVTHLRKSSSLKIEIEVETLDELKGVIRYKPDIVMLDNFSLQEMKKAVVFRDKYFPKIKLESSVGVNLDNVRKIANTGVDFISIGRITHSPPAIDFSLEILDG